MKEQSFDLQNEIKVRMENLSELHFVGIRVSPPGHDVAAIKALWDQLESKLPDIENRINEGVTYEISDDKFAVAVAVSGFGRIPEELVAISVPAGDYAVFHFEEKYIGDFWSSFCPNPQIKAKYRLNYVTPRFEVFNQELQPNGYTEVYIPTTN
ncbi:MAG: AraC family transcriptional regulator [Paenibacillus sp.]|jgi:predicted transcriptional regulator YdeE|nr:AraC family transcriptional regulator [Paenibacillus sp.]